MRCVPQKAQGWKVRVVLSLSFALPRQTHLCDNEKEGCVPPLLQELTVMPEFCVDKHVTFNLSLPTTTSALVGMHW